MKIIKPTFLDALSFFIAIFSFVYFRMVGNIYISELLLLLVLFFSLKRNGRKLFDPLPKRILLFGFIWLLSQIVTDMIRLTPLTSMIKGCFSIIFFLIDFAALYILLYGNERRLHWFIMGFAIGGILKCFINPGYGFDTEPWKFGFGFPIIMLSVLLLSWSLKKKLFFPIIIEGLLVMLGLLSIYLNSRSLGGTVIFTALVLFISRQQFFYNIFIKRWGPGSVLGMAAVAIALLSLILVAYQWAGESYILPEKSQAKYELNKSASLGIFGVILAGRHEFIASIPAVIDSPIIGHGSWAEDPKYRLYLYEVNNILGTDFALENIRRTVEETDSIPAHSHLMQSWVWAGFLGAYFWLVVLFIIAKSFFLSIRFQHAYTMILVFIVIKASWELLFSPFSSIMRFYWGWELVLIIMAHSMARNIELTKQREPRRVL